MRKILILSLCALPMAALAQKERADIRSGNKQFNAGKYAEAEVDYKRALEKNINSYEANFNLGGALYKQGRNEDATVAFQKIIEDGTNPENQAKTFYNLGNTLVKQRKLDEAIESYKNALRLDPTDVQAKFNLAYAQKLKQEDENKDKDQNKDQNQDNKQNQDQNKDQNDQNKDQKDDPNKEQEKDNKDNKDNKDKKDNKDQQQQQNQSKSEADRMLKAIQAAEDNTKKKVDEQKAQAVGVGKGKQW